MSVPPHRPYQPGEDMGLQARLIVVCQGPRSRPYLKICGLEVEREGRYRMAGGWHVVYHCPEGHRFAITTNDKGTRSVVDVPTGKATFGDALGF